MGAESLSCPLLEWEGLRQGLWERKKDGSVTWHVQGRNFWRCPQGQSRGRGSAGSAPRAFARAQGKGGTGGGGGERGVRGSLRYGGIPHQ